MPKWRFPTAFSSWRPYDDSAEWAAYERVLYSGQLTMAGETAAFEEEIAAYHGRRHAIACNSGSSANLVAVAAWSLKRGVSFQFKRGIYASVPSISWSTTYAPLVQHGYDLAINDVDDTWTALQTKIGTGELPLVVAVSILGNPSNVFEFPELIAIEDNCEAVGARTSTDRLTGTFGELSTGSGFFSHQLSAVELGWVLTDDPGLAYACRLLRNHGNDGWHSGLFEASYNFQLFGYNVRPIEAHCAVAREQLKRLDEMVEVRRANLLHFTDQTSKLRVKHQKLTSRYCSPFGLAFEVESNEVRARLVKALRANGIDCRLPTGGSFLKHPYSKPWQDQKTPRADEIHTRGLFLGNAPYDIRHLIDEAVRVLREVL
jgi:CDP-6-deoxy-D-xylo-4-hexulose-3-dehydrase